MLDHISGIFSNLLAAGRQRSDQRLGEVGAREHEMVQRVVVEILAAQQEVDDDDPELGA